MQHLNLIEARLLPPLRVVSGARLAGMVLAGAAIVLAHWGIERVALARALATATATEAADGSASAEPGSDDTLAPLRERVAQRQALRDLLAADALPREPASLLQAVIDALPPTLWLTEIELARERALRIAGGALDAAAFDEFAARLNRVPPLRGAPVRTVRLEPGEREANDEAGAALPAHWRFVLVTGGSGAQEGAR